jgi:hypothetical protein
MSKGELRGTINGRERIVYDYVSFLGEQERRRLLEEVK